MKKTIRKIQMLALAASALVLFEANAADGTVDEHVSHAAESAGGAKIPLSPRSTVSDSGKRPGFASPPLRRGSNTSVTGGHENRPPTASRRVAGSVTSDGVASSEARRTNGFSPRPTKPTGAMGGFGSPEALISKGARISAVPRLTGPQLATFKKFIEENSVLSGFSGILIPKEKIPSFEKFIVDAFESIGSGERVASLESDLRRVLDENAGLRNHIVTLESQLTDERATLAELEALKESLDVKKSGEDQETKERGEVVKRLSAQLAEAREALRRQASDITTKESEIARIEHEKAILAARLAEIERANESLRGESITYQTELERARIALSVSREPAASGAGRSTRKESITGGDDGRSVMSRVTMRSRATGFTGTSSSRKAKTIELPEIIRPFALPIDAVSEMLDDPFKFFEGLNPIIRKADEEVQGYKLGKDGLLAIEFSEPATLTRGAVGRAMGAGTKIPVLSGTAMRYALGFLDKVLIGLSEPEVKAVKKVFGTIADAIKKAGNDQLYIYFSIPVDESGNPTDTFSAVFVTRDPSYPYVSVMRAWNIEAMNKNYPEKDYELGSSPYPISGGADDDYTGSAADGDGDSH